MGVLGVNPAVRFSAPAIVLALVAAAVAWWWPGGSAPPPAAPMAAPPAALVQGRIALAPGSGPAPESGMVVVYAYATDGAQAPLAVWRGPAAALPAEFRLERGAAPGASTGAGELIIGARLGPGGEPLAQVGDWLAGSQKLVPGAQGVQLLLLPPAR